MSTNGSGFLNVLAGLNDVMYLYNVSSSPWPRQETYKRAAGCLPKFARAGSGDHLQQMAIMFFD